MSTNEQLLSQEEVTKLLKMKKEEVVRERPPTIEELNFIFVKLREQVEQIEKKRSSTRRTRNEKICR